MPQLGPAEVLVILFVALLVFGPKRLPEVGRQVGRGLHELRKLQETVTAEINDVIHADTPETAAPAIPPPVYRTSGEPPASRARPAPRRHRPPRG
jgi:TatA/E family protein of Tat protein translocase